MSAALLVTAASLRPALSRWCDALDTAAPELNALDGRLGDGDLGTTLHKCSANVRGTVLPGGADSLAALFKACAQACAKASGSSFGTLLAVGFLTAAKRCEADALASLDRATLAALLAEIGQALSARGGAKLGDKTLLDSLHALAEALRHAPPDGDAAALKTLALQAATDALDTYRGRPNQIGRARMFAEQSIGLDDPGMVAMQRMVAAL